MRYNDGEKVLRSMLSAEGFDRGSVEFSEAWMVFKSFAAIPIEEELPTRDLFSFTGGLWPAPSDAHAYICLLRSMSRAYSPNRGEDEYGDKVETVEELFFSFRFPYEEGWPDDDINSWDFLSLEAFFTAIERRGAFQWAWRIGTTEIDITQRKLY